MLMEIVTFEDGDTNADLIRKLKAAKGPVEIHIKAHGGEVPSDELLALIKEKVAKSTLEAKLTSRLLDSDYYGYKYLDQ